MMNTNKVTRIEGLCRGLDKAWATGDRVNMFRLTMVLLNEILAQHAKLREECLRLESAAISLNTLPTTHHSDSHEYHSGRGWGRSSGRGYWAGTEGHAIRTIPEIDVKARVQLESELLAGQKAYNAALKMLHSYAVEFAKYRKQLLELKPNNVGQRTLQNVLSVSRMGIAWGSKSIERNPVLGVINGEFSKHYRSGSIMHRYVKGLTDKKGLIGRSSETEGRSIVEGSRDRTKKSIPETMSKNVRWYSVSNYVSKSERYKARLGWIVGLKTTDTLAIMPYVDDWKRQYESLDRLGRSLATTKLPYVPTIISGRVVQCGEVEVLETTVPIYQTTGIQYANGMTNGTVYFLGKTGSSIVDKLTTGIDWYHSNAPAVNYVATFENRLRYITGQTQSLKQRRREIAQYARKLVWIETMSMMDSKRAGNCLPGTRQFAAEIGISCPSDWQDHIVDARQVLRKWKASGYNANRLLLPAIDAAVNRVKAALCQLTVSCYVPSAVK